MCILLLRIIRTLEKLDSQTHRLARYYSLRICALSGKLGEQGSLLIHRFLSISVTLFLLSACTTGKLYYTEASGERLLACDVEFVGLPSVDKFAVEYALSLCAKNSVKKGHSLDKEMEYLLTLDLQIPESKCGESWNHESAKEQYKTGKLSKKEYGYIVAHIDLGLAVVNECSPNNSINSPTSFAGTHT